MKTQKAHDGPCFALHVLEKVTCVFAFLLTSPWVIKRLWTIASWVIGTWLVSPVFLRVKGQ